MKFFPWSLARTLRVMHQYTSPFERQVHLAFDFRFLDEQAVSVKRSTSITKSTRSLTLWNVERHYGQLQEGLSFLLIMHQ